MIHVHQLDGCAPAPLAHYLKALGILRLVAEQVDSDARGWWDGDRYRLATKLTREELTTFFLREYRPTPIFNPWGARSGFFSGASEKSARDSLRKLESSSSRRLDSFRTAIKMVRSVITSESAKDKPSDTEKKRWIFALRSNARGKSSLWLDTVISLIGAGDDLSIAQPPIFGTGGNEGSGGYPSAYMSAIVESLVEANWDHAVLHALFGGTTPRCRWNQSMGQFAPGSASTPWDMLFAFEGACTLRSSIGVRTSTCSTRWMSSPFYVAPRSSGYASGSRLDEKFLNKGREYPGRGEQWLPLWTKPARYVEVQQIFLDGRAATRAGRATDGWTMARAVAGLGVSRGVRHFLRYGYQQRNNQATHFAVPLGRFSVPDVELASFAGPSCLDDLDVWLRALHREAHPADDQKAKRIPDRLTNTYGHLMDVLFSVLNGRTTAQHYQEVLLHLANLEAIMAHGTGFGAQPVPRLRPEWVVACDDGAAEFRLALALALQAQGFHRDTGKAVDPIRRHWLPLDRRHPWRFATTSTGGGTRLDVKPDVVMHGRRGVDDAIALVERRLVEGAQRKRRHLPLQAAPRTAACIADVAMLLEGGVDLDRTLAMARALMALDREAWFEQHVSIPRPRSAGWPDDAWLAIRLCTLPWPLRTSSGFKLDVGADPAVVRRLAAGDAATAFDLASRRLGAAGLRCTVRAAAAGPDTARLWAGALAFPITQRTARRFLHRLDPNKE